MLNINNSVSVARAMRPNIAYFEQHMINHKNKIISLWFSIYTSLTGEMIEDQFTAACAIFAPWWSKFKMQ